MLDPPLLVTRASNVLLPDSVVVVDHVFEPTVKLVAFDQVAPPSYETSTLSPLAKFADKVPLMVCAAVLVTKSDALVPESADRLALRTVVVGAVAPEVACAATTILSR